MNWEATGVGVGVLTIFFGLIGPSVVAWWYRPRLRVVSDAPESERLACRTAGAELPHGGFICWLRMPIHNVGRSTAQDVRVILTSIRADPEAARRPPSRECKWADMPETFLALPLPPRVSRLVDIAHVVCIRAPQADSSSSGAVTCGLVVGAVPFGDWDGPKPTSPLWLDVASGAELRIDISVMASNAAARNYTMSISLSAPGDLKRTQQDLTAVVPSRARPKARPTLV
jgi:hypothetical protein